MRHGRRSRETGRATSIGSRSRRHIARSTADACSGRGGSARAVYGAVSARVHRQAILADPDKHFDFVMSEAALSNRICPPEEMPAQILRIREVAAQPNVTISIIPADAHWSIPPYHGFSILDDRHLFVDLYETGLSKHDQSDADLYGAVFDAMKVLAVQDVEPILERYRRQYARELAAG
jgi:hypothetical protein